MRLVDAIDIFYIEAVIESIARTNDDDGSCFAEPEAARSDNFYLILLPVSYDQIEEALFNLR